MSSSNPKILIISSCPLTMGPAVMAGQYRDALRRKGLEVDMLLRDPEPGHPDIFYATGRLYYKSILIRIRRRLFLAFRHLKNAEPNYIITYEKENHPHIPTWVVLKRIKKKYDLVIVVFWQYMLSFETIKGIYDKLHCQIQFMGVDYFHMSGGCHFTGDCQRYKIGCGCCPAIHSNDPNDFTAWNVRYRKKVYEKVKPIVYGNSYMMEFYKKSFLLKDANCEILPSAIIDTDVFKPLDSESLRKKYNIPDNKRFVLFFASQMLDDERKGISYLLESLHMLFDTLGDKAKEVLVLLVGKNYDAVSNKIDFDSLGLGYVQMDVLPELFSLSTCYICTSINDAGPMMVNQSLCCGTPVVGFEVGSVIQFVKDQGTGVCVPSKDSSALAEGIHTIIDLTPEQYQEMSTKARKVALDNCSYEASANIILNNYYKNSTIGDRPQLY